MKLKKVSILGFASMMMLGMASCSNDILEEPDQTLEAAETVYIPISVNSFANETRAGGQLGDYEGEYDPEDDPNFSAGDDGKHENDVKSVFLVFYDSNRERVAYTQSILSNLEEGDASTDPNINKLYTGIVQVELTEGRGTPTYVLAFINPTSSRDFGGPSFKTLGDVERLQRDVLITEDQFAMSNSVYYAYHPVTQNPNARIMATPIANGQIFTSKAAAQAAISDPENGDKAYVDIFVERYAGKVNFSYVKDGLENLKMKDFNGETYELEFVPEVWAVNATEKYSFVTKNFFTDGGDGTFDFDQPATFVAMNETLGGTGETMAWKWNSSENHRSYWGQSPGYYEGRYPRVSDDIMDAEGWQKGKHEGYEGSYPLNYYSYEELIKGATGRLDAIARSFNSATTTDAIYARENTVSGTSLKNAYDDPTASPKSAIASVVMVGRYQVKKGNGQMEDYVGKFYVTGNEANGYVFYNEEQILNFFVNNTLSLAKDEQGTPFFDYQVASDVNKAKFNDTEFKKYFTVEHPSAAVRGNLVMDSRYVTVQLNKEAVGKIWAKVGDVYMEVTDDNLNTINQSIMSGAGTAYGFDGGKAYFNVPIQHLGFYSKNNENKGISPLSSDFNWEKTKSGEFGIVRNHYYTIQATKITGLGNGIPDPDAPIVPPTEPEYYIGARINILNWAIVPTQKVEW